MIIIFLIALSMGIYYVFSRKDESILINPNLKNLLFFRDFLLLTIIPYLYYWNKDRYLSHYVLKQLHGKHFIVYAAISAVVFLFLFLLIFNTLKKYFDKKIALFEAKYSLRYKIKYDRLILILSILSIALFVITLYLSYAYNSGIFGIVFLSSEDIALTRHFLSHSGGIFALNKIFMKSWVPMTSYLFVYLYLTNNQKFTLYNLLSLALALIAGLLAALFFMEKATLFFYLMGFLGVYMFTGKKINRYFLPVMAILAVALVGAMYVFIYKNQISSTIGFIQPVLRRIAMQSVGSIMAFDYFSYHNFKGMAGVSNFWASLSNQVFSSPYSDIIKFYVPEYIDISGAMSSFVTGEAYGLFGPFGILLSGFIVAIYLSFFESAKNSNLLAIPFVGMYSFYFSNHIVASSFYGFVWPVGIGYGLLPFFLLLFVSIEKN